MVEPPATQSISIRRFQAIKPRLIDWLVPAQPHKQGKQHTHCSSSLEAQAAKRRGGELLPDTKSGAATASQPASQPHLKKCAPCSPSCFSSCPQLLFNAPFDSRSIQRPQSANQSISDGSNPSPSILGSSGLKRTDDRTVEGEGTATREDTLFFGCSKWAGAPRPMRFEGFGGPGLVALVEFGCQPGP